MHKQTRFLKWLTLNKELDNYAAALQIYEHFAAGTYNYIKAEETIARLKEEFKLYDINVEVKQRIETINKEITELEGEREAIRAGCSHTETFEGYYSYRVGSVILAKICSACGEFIKQVDAPKYTITISS